MVYWLVLFRLRAYGILVFGSCLLCFSFFLDLVCLFFFILCGLFFFSRFCLFLVVGFWVFLGIKGCSFFGFCFYYMVFHFFSGGGFLLFLNGFWHILGFCLVLCVLGFLCLFDLCVECGFLISLCWFSCLSVFCAVYLFSRSVSSGLLLCFLWMVLLSGVGLFCVWVMRFCC